MSIVKNSPDMNITNQINAALNDVRATLIEMANWPHVADSIVLQFKCRYQLDLAVQMINEHRAGKSIAWSDRKPMVEEEFDE